MNLLNLLNKKALRAFFEFFGWFLALVAPGASQFPGRSTAERSEPGWRKRAGGRDVCRMPGPDAQERVSGAPVAPAVPDFHSVAPRPAVILTAPKGAMKKKGAGACLWRPVERRQPVLGPPLLPKVTLWRSTGVFFAPERSGRQRQALDAVLFQLVQQPLGFRPLGWIVGQVPDGGDRIVKPARRFEPVADFGRGPGQKPDQFGRAIAGRKRPARLCPTLHQHCAHRPALQPRRDFALNFWPQIPLNFCPQIPLDLCPVSDHRMRLLRDHLEAFLVLWPHPEVQPFQPRSFLCGNEFALVFVPGVHSMLKPFSEPHAARQRGWRVGRVSGGAGASPRDERRPARRICRSALRVVRTARVTPVTSLLLRSAMAEARDDAAAAAILAVAAGVRRRVAPRRSMRNALAG